MGQILELLEEDNDSDEDQEPAAELNGIKDSDSDEDQEPAAELNGIKDNDSDEDQEPAAELNGIILLPPTDGRKTDEDSDDEI